MYVSFIICRSGTALKFPMNLKGKPKPMGRMRETRKKDNLVRQGRVGVPLKFFFMKIHAF
jgi:hypothetical protein